MFCEYYYSLSLRNELAVSFDVEAILFGIQKILLWKKMHQYRFHKNIV